MAKNSKKKQEVDISRFEPLVEEALRAFGEDVSYAIDMSKKAVTVERKRMVWKIRLAAKKAENKAREECEKNDFVCAVDNPCGTGDCRFASPEYSQIKLTGTGKVVRPSNSTQESYTLEPVISYLLEEATRKSPKSSKEDE